MPGKLDLPSKVCKTCGTLSSNLQTLCKSCHDFWHATAKRLGRPVAGRMPSLGLPMKEPIGHTDLKPLGMDRCLYVVQQHGECLTYGEAANV